MPLNMYGLSTLNILTDLKGQKEKLSALWMMYGETF